MVTHLKLTQILEWWVEVDHWEVSVRDPVGVGRGGSRCRGVYGLPPERHMFLVEVNEDIEVLEGRAEGLL